MPGVAEPITGSIAESMFKSMFGSDSPWAVILFNDEEHTFDDVAGQLQKAIGCTRDEGYAFANTVHTEGQAKVFEGDLTSCERVAAILEQIQLKVKLEVQ